MAAPSFRSIFVYNPNTFTGQYDWIDYSLPHIYIPSGSYSGAGVVDEDFDGNGTPDVVFNTVKSNSNAHNELVYKVAYSFQSNVWTNISSLEYAPTPIGWFTQGCGITSIIQNGIGTNGLRIMAINKSNGYNGFRLNKASFFIETSNELNCDHCVRYIY